jgi:hypothetical protein
MRQSGHVFAISIHFDKQVRPKICPHAVMVTGSSRGGVSEETVTHGGFGRENDSKQMLQVGVGVSEGIVGRI